MKLKSKKYLIKRKIIQFPRFILHIFDRVENLIIKLQKGLVKNKI